MFAAGGISTLDLILECIKKIKGKNYSDEIAQALIYRPREKSTMQKDDQFNLSIDNICSKINFNNGKKYRNTNQNK